MSRSPYTNGGLTTSAAQQQHQQRFVSSRDLAEEFLMLKDTIDAFIFGADAATQGVAKGATRDGCAVHTFSQDREGLFALSEKLRGAMKAVMMAVATNTVGMHSPTRRALSPTNSTAVLEPSAIHHSGLAVGSELPTVLISTRGGSASLAAPPSLPSKQPATPASPSESLNEIAARYSVPMSDLRAHNPKFAIYKDDEKLPPNSAVRIPTYAAPSAGKGAAPASPRGLGVTPLSSGLNPGHGYGNESPSSPTFGDVGAYAGAAATPQRCSMSAARNASPMMAATPYNTASGAPFNAPVDRALESSLAAPPMSPMVMNQSANASNSGGFSGNLAILQSEQPQRQTVECDSLWSLAKEYDIPVRELLRANPQLRNFGVNETLPPQLVVAIPIAN